MAGLQRHALALAVDQGQFRHGAVRRHGHDLDRLIGFGVEGRNPEMRLAGFCAGIILGQRHRDVCTCQQASEEIVKVS